MSNQAMLRGLLAGEVEFVVVGGVAAIMLGSPLHTNDLDICYETSDRNVARMVGVLRGWNAYLRGVERGLPWVLDLRAVRTNPVLTLIGDQGLIDIMDRLDGVGDYMAALAVSNDATWDDLRFRILSLDALVAAKRAAGRRKDQIGLRVLEAVREERRKRGL
jgi:hypothetical protein